MLLHEPALRSLRPSLEGAAEPIALAAGAQSALVPVFALPDFDELTDGLQANKASPRTMIFKTWETLNIRMVFPSPVRQNALCLSVKDLRT